MVTICNYISIRNLLQERTAMTTILHIASSSNLHNSVSREIGAATVERLKEADPDAKVITWDLVQHLVLHIDPAFVGAMFTNHDAPELALSRTLIAEVMASDILVIEAPMYNFNIPSVLKAWIDHVVRGGITVKYGAAGVEDQLKGKKAVLMLGRGGVYADGPMKAMDYQETYLRTVLGFVGITDIEVVIIEGVAMGPETRAEALANARAKIDMIASRKAA